LDATLLVKAGNSVQLESHGLAVGIVWAKSQFSIVSLGTNELVFLKLIKTEHDEAKNESC